MSTADEILKGAIAEFAEHGLAGARVDRIARRAGVNKAMIYYHFSSKEALYQAVIDSKLRLISDCIHTALDDGDSAEAVFLKVSHFYVSVLRQSAEMRPIMMRELAGGARYLREAFGKYIGGKSLPFRLKALIEQGKESGSYRDVDSRQAIISFIGMNLFFLMVGPVISEIWGIDNDEEFIEERPAAIVDLFLHGIKAR
jgi:TetR/AcrR family transcriptional regulator